MTEIPKGTFQRHFENTKTMSRKQAEEICRAGEPAVRERGVVFQVRQEPR
jgi:hypothetical protein